MEGGGMCQMAGIYTAQYSAVRKAAEDWRKRTGRRLAKRTLLLQQSMTLCLLFSCASKTSGRSFNRLKSNGGGASSECARDDLVVDDEADGFMSCVVRSCVEPSENDAALLTC